MRARDRARPGRFRMAATFRASNSSTERMAPSSIEDRGRRLYNHFRARALRMSASAVSSAAGSDQKLVAAFGGSGTLLSNPNSLEQDRWQGGSTLRLEQLDRLPG